MTSVGGMEIKAELGPDGRSVVTTPEGAVAVFRVEGRLYAIRNACPHVGNPLVEGDVLGRTLVCAFHGWRFDLETGVCLLGEESVRTYPVEERDGEIWVDTSPG